MAHQRDWHWVWQKARQKDWHWDQHWESQKDWQKGRHWDCWKAQQMGWHLVPGRKLGLVMAFHLVEDLMLEVHWGWYLGHHLG